jgi:hypothetical protein
MYCANTIFVTGMSSWVHGEQRSISQRSHVSVRITKMPRLFTSLAIIMSVACETDYYDCNFVRGDLLIESSKSNSLIKYAQ